MTNVIDNPIRLFLFELIIIVISLILFIWIVLAIKEEYIIQDNRESFCNENNMSNSYDRYGSYCYYFINNTEIIKYISVVDSKIYFVEGAK